MDPITLVYELLATAAIVAGGIWFLIQKIDARFDSIESKQTNLQQQFDVQFGGNGNGIRQAINEHGKDIAFIKGSLGISQD